MKTQIKQGDKVLVSPDVTRLDKWITGKVIEVENNPIRGIVITVETEIGEFFDVEESFKPYEQKSA